MPKVPVYEQQVTPQVQAAPTPQAQMIEYSKPLLQAFGGDVAESEGNVAIAIKNLGNEGAGVMDQLQKHMIELKKRDSEKAAFDAGSKYLLEKDNFLHGQEKDATGNITFNGLMNRENDDAIGATREYDAWSKQKKEEYIAEGTPYQKELVSRMIDSDYNSSRDTITVHEARQGQNAYKIASEALIKNMASQSQSGDYADPEKLKQLMLQAGTVAEESTKRLGIKNQAAIELQTSAAKGIMAKGAVTNLLETDVKGARTLFDSVKGELSGDAVADIEKVIKGKEFLDTQVSIYNHTKNFRLASGEGNTQAAENYIDSLKMTTEQKEDTKKYVIAKMKEDDSQLQQRREAATDSLLNETYKYKANGGSMDQAMPLATKYGHDLKDQADKKELIRKIFTSNKESDPQKWLALYKGVQERTVTQGDLDMSMKNEEISVSDWRSLSTELYNPNSQNALVMHTIEAQAKEKFGTDTVKINGQDVPSTDQFMYMVKQRSLGKTPEETQKIANDMLKDVVVKKRTLWFDKTKPQYEIESEIKKARDLTMGTFYQQMGADVVNGIGTDPEVVGKFIEDNGGYTEFLIGRPKNNAIRTLRTRGLPVTPTKIAEILAISADGIIPLDITLKMAPKQQMIGAR